MSEIINLVNPDGVRIGAIEKIKAHEESVLHEAFSIFIFNDKRELLLQKRASAKYHSGGLWTNTCCGHSRVGEDLIDAAKRRLKEEMGFECELKETYAFTYRVQLPNGMTENEYDYVLIGNYSGDVNPDPNEAESYTWIDIEVFKQDVKNYPEKYTYWVKEIVKLNKIWDMI